MPISGVVRANPFSQGAGIDHLILDTLRVHHARLIKKWLEKHKNRIEVFYLPTYSSELNPDESFNGDLKMLSEPLHRQEVRKN
ncbi:transposase [Xenorhabdus cabanillasii]|uniref:Tc1-like transposase DDE domain-containing protein n=1 Tax=Xenorhabdus cabanillasii JM26 TaxID=1427517 RepID=W1IRJ7_9GAMM|nr:transposase [Xenorhabdus cabanillasii JM26]CDL79850.1 hypothetical protein XCR1_1250027 [Xenorhabdus cabanillasii JM26]